MARVRFLDQVPVGFYDVDNGGGGNPGGPFSSIQYNDGGTLNGDSDLLWDRNTNTVLLTGSIIATSFTGSLFGTSSWAQSSSQAQTASYVLSASYALSSSFALSSSQALTASYVNPLNQNVIITGSLNTSGSVFFPTLVTSSTAVTNVVMYGTNGQLFTTASTAIGGGSTPGLPFNSIQYNDGGTLNGDIDLLWDKNTNTVLLNGSLSNGFNSIASGSYSHAEGISTVASGTYSHAEGSETISSGSYSHAEGTNTQAIGAASHAEGVLTVASGDFSHAEGYLTTANGTRSHAEGDTTIANGIGSHAEGLVTIASGNYSHAEGANTIASGSYSHTEGQNTTASGDYSHAEGIGTITSASYQHAQGMYNITSPITGAFILGNGTDLNNRSNLIFAAGNQVQITGSLSNGFNNIASGLYSHAEGLGTQAIGDYSHAEGFGARAYGTSSHAEGFGARSFGDYSHAEGSYTRTNGTSSHAEGLYTITEAEYQHAQGMYNITSSISGAFILGNGTSTINRSNLIFAAGNQVQITGSLNTSGSVFFPTLVTSSTAVSNVVMYGTNGQLFITASSAIGGGGGISGDYVTTASFNAYTGSSTSQFAGTASFAQTASYVPTLKASSASVASFTGQPYSASVTFATAYPNNLYAVSVIGEDSRAWSISGKSPSGFTIDSNSSFPLTNPVYWIATPFNS